MDTVKLFVYGTLKKGQCREYLLEGSTFLGDVKTEPKYSLYDGGQYPMLKEGGKTAVKGELWEIPTSLIPTLNRIEGVEFNLYKKTSISIDGFTDVIGYTYQQSTSFYRKCGNQWPPISEKKYGISS